MNKLGMLLIIIGAACLWCAASNDGYYESIGESYPLINIVLWSAIGFISIISGCKMNKLI